MAKLKADSYESLCNLMANKAVGQSVVIGNNTLAEKRDGYFIVSLHGHDIMYVHHDHVDFTLAGYPTVRTRDRINSFLREDRVIQKNHNQYLVVGDKMDKLDMYSYWEAK